MLRTANRPGRQNQREFARVPLADHPILLLERAPRGLQTEESVRAHEAWAVDVSIDAARVRCADAPPVGAAVCVRLVLDATRGPERVVMLPGRIVRVRRGDDGWHAAIHFSGIERADHTLLARWLFQQIRARAA